jgi:hypothetical protein
VLFEMLTGTRAFAGDNITDTLAAVVSGEHQSRGSIGIEVKCLGSDGHTGKLTQGLGQAMLAISRC